MEQHQLYFVFHAKSKCWYAKKVKHYTCLTAAPGISAIAESSATVSSVHVGEFANLELPSRQD